MANEFVHNSVGNNCTQNEWEDVALHKLNNQATGDLVAAISGTQIGRTPVGSAGTILTSMNNEVTYGEDSLIGIFTYISGSGNHNKNQYTTKMLVLGVGGGGGGGGARANNASAAGAGGGSGSMFRRFILSPNDSYAYAIGSGGTGGENNGAVGTAGTATTFDALGDQNLSASEGSPAYGQNFASNVAMKVTRPGNGGAVATGNGSLPGDLFAQGSAGRKGSGGTRLYAAGGRGASGWGAGGKGGNAVTATGNANESGGAGDEGGGGGGGAASSNAVGTIMNANGGNGGNGILIVWEFS